MTSPRADGQIPEGAAAPHTEAVFTEKGRDLSERGHQSRRGPAVEQGEALANTLKPRHLSMIALGGVIGAGLLVASSTAILAAGPAVILAYALAGVVVVLVMRMLGEMASISPETGSFSAYATRFIGPWAGLSIGWLYWWFWVVVVGIEATAAAVIISGWLPEVPQWIPALIITLVFLIANLISVKSFGEFEFWFASIKIVSIIIFIIVGALLIAHVIPNNTATFGNLAPADGGFAPFGVAGILAALLPVIFSMFGAEVATIAAGESEQPAQAVRKAVNSVVWRILLFYIGSILVVLIVLPWDQITAGVSPFVTMLNAAGIGWAALAMDIIVLSALLSTLNASLYTASRMAFSLSRRGEAPKAFRKVSKRGTPYVAILASAVVGLLSVVLNYTTPEYVFSFLVNSTGAVAIFVWIVIAVSQLRSRRILAEDAVAAGEDPNAITKGAIRMWGFPWLTWVVIVALSALLIYMFFAGETRLIEVTTSFIIAGISIVAGVSVQRKQKRERAAAAVAPASSSASGPASAAASE
ncbi:MULTISPECIES: amino acid permease [unclassified Pseudoclavibacter]|uniref:amino acid permease n=1 Tax=unclassified Pseudoclavibacter TaxID=2615177 RepID=UPI001BA8AB08|nr:amino acid permease [Pseudoclavibacter sp. Marseille-Q4354]MBS3178936.1 amino acid permease [Pseudoclavibacter sp. Marseille-Q4354]